MLREVSAELVDGGVGAPLVLVIFSEDVKNDGVIVIVAVLKEPLKGVEIVERVLVKLTEFVDISEEDFSLDTVFGEVSAELVD